MSWRELQTITVAASVSLLAYNPTPQEALLHDNEFQHLREAQLVDKVWQIDQFDGSVIAAWSPRLETVFIAFRGSVTAQDWLSTNLRVRVTLDDANGWAVHEGFSAAAAKLPSALIELFIKSHRTVLCGHSLGWVTNSIHQCWITR
jgi:predicted lipase